MDVYSKETFELIQSERDTARKRHILTAIEMELKRIIPTTTIPGHHCTYPRLDKIQDRETLDRIEYLLHTRSYLLNQNVPMQPGQKNESISNKSNELLLGLTRQMYAHTANLYRAMHQSLKRRNF